MRASTIVMIGFAVVFGLLAVFIAQVVAEQPGRQPRKEPARPTRSRSPRRRIVVADKPLRFGSELDASMLREMPWPQAALPAGAFAKINDVLAAAAASC